jgi:hypothetical protein
LNSRRLRADVSHGTGILCGYVFFGRRFDVGERPDVRVMVASPSERFNEMQMKATSDGGEAERLKTSLRELPASCEVTVIWGKKWLDRE